MDASSTINISPCPERPEVLLYNPGKDRVLHHSRHIGTHISKHACENNFNPNSRTPTIREEVSEKAGQLLLVQADLVRPACRECKACLDVELRCGRQALAFPMQHKRSKVKCKATVLQCCIWRHTQLEKRADQLRHKLGPAQQQISAQQLQQLFSCPTSSSPKRRQARPHEEAWMALNCTASAAI